MKSWATGYKILSACFHHPEEPLLAALQEMDCFRESLLGVSLETLQREQTKLFSLTVAGGISPYETEYGHKDIFLKTQSLADISGFYRAFGMEMSDRIQERVDFIGAELELMYWLSLKEENAEEAGRPVEAGICRDAAAKFLCDHLGRWASFFGDQIAKQSGHPFFRQVGQWLVQLVDSECRRLGVEPERVTGWNPEPISTTEFSCGIDL